MTTFTGSKGDYLAKELLDKGYAVIYYSAEIATSNLDKLILSDITRKMKEVANYTPFLCRIDDSQGNQVNAVVFGMTVKETLPISQYSASTFIFVRTDRFIGAAFKDLICNTFLVFDRNEFEQRLRACLLDVLGSKYTIQWSNYGPNAWVPHFMSACLTLSRQSWTTNTVDSLVWQPLSVCLNTCNACINYISGFPDCLEFLPRRQSSSLSVLEYDGKVLSSHCARIASWLLLHIPMKKHLLPNWIQIFELIREGIQIFADSAYFKGGDLIEFDTLVSAGVDTSRWKGYQLNYLKNSITNLAKLSNYRLLNQLKQVDPWKPLTGKPANTN